MLERGLGRTRSPIEPIESLYKEEEDRGEAL